MTVISENNHATNDCDQQGPWMKNHVLLCSVQRMLIVSVMNKGNEKEINNLNW